MNSDLPNNFELSNGEPNYDEILKDFDFTPFCGLGNRFDRQIWPIIDKLKELGYSSDFTAKVAIEAMRRYDKNMEEFLKTEAYNDE